MEPFGAMLNKEYFDNNGNEFLKFDADGRDSLILGRESLGILSVSEMDVTFNPDCGRESLGIIDVEKLNISLHNSCKYLNSPLNTAFLFSTSYAKHFPSTSTISEVSFHSESLNGSDISKIYSLRSSKISNDTLNEAFESGECLLQKFSKDYQEKVGLMNTEKKDEKEHSLPEISNILGCDNHNLTKQQRRCISEGGSIDKETRELNVSAIKSQNFEDSVFIEASYIAMKLQNMSIAEEDELFNIDKTSPPKELDLEEVAEESVRRPINVFKTIDKMIPPKTELNSSISECNTSVLNKSKSCDIITSCSPKVTPKNNKTNIAHCQTLPRKRRSYGVENNEYTNNRSQDDVNQNKFMKRSLSDGHIGINKEVKNILFNLSNIISNELEDDKQKEESKNLLSSLADILLSKSDDSKDSHDSNDLSVEKKHNEVIDSNSKNDYVETEKETKVNKFSSFFSNPKIGLPKILSRNKAVKVATNNVAQHNKLKPKKIESGLKRGPLKAMIPIGNMAKTGVSDSQNNLFSLISTPNKAKLSEPLNKRTSTPISKKSMKPIAQSTPETSSNQSNSLCESFSKVKKTYIPSSPLARPSSTAKSYLTDISGMVNTSKHNVNSSQSSSNVGCKTSSDTSEIENKCATMERRHSASELKKPISLINLKRSLSAAQESKAGPSLLPKTKDKQIFKPRYSSKDNSNSLKTKINGPHRNSEGQIENNILKARNRIFSDVKATKLISKMTKKQGKENEF